MASDALVLYRPFRITSDSGEVVPGVKLFQYDPAVQNLIRQIISDVRTFSNSTPVFHDVTRLLSHSQGTQGGRTAPIVSDSKPMPNSATAPAVVNSSSLNQLASTVQSQNSTRFSQSASVNPSSAPISTKTDSHVASASNNANLATNKSTLSPNITQSTSVAGSKTTSNPGSQNIAYAPNEGNSRSSVPPAAANSIPDSSNRANFMANVGERSQSGMVFSSNNAQSLPASASGSVAPHLTPKASSQENVNRPDIKSTVQQNGVFAQTSGGSVSQKMVEQSSSSALPRSEVQQNSGAAVNPSKTSIVSEMSKTSQQGGAGTNVLSSQAQQKAPNLAANPLSSSREISQSQLSAGLITAPVRDAAFGPINQPGSLTRSQMSGHESASQNRAAPSTPAGERVANPPAQTAAGLIRRTEATPQVLPASTTALTSPNRSNSKKKRKEESMDDDEDETSDDPSQKKK